MVAVGVWMRLVELLYRASAVRSQNEIRICEKLIQWKTLLQAGVVKICSNLNTIDYKSQLVVDTLRTTAGM
jgi:hypothetical protein